MNLLSFPESPITVQLSFYQVIENLEKIAAGPVCQGSIHANKLLQEIAPFPELKNGITEASQILDNTEIISRLLVDYFPPALTLNEIKAVNIPYSNLFFNYSERFRNILHAAGPDFKINIRDFDEQQFYIMSCCIILNEFYGTKLDFTKPLFYDIPSADGVIRHYRILYNADFLEILPTDKSVALTQDDIDLLMNNYDNLELWKEKFPVESWALKGFSIITLFDATVENAVSIFKEKLISSNVIALQQSIDSIFRSIYRIPDLNVGFAVFNQQDNTFSMDAYGPQVRSFILPDKNQRDSREVLCLLSYHKLIEKQVYFSVADTLKFLQENPESTLAIHFAAQGIQSFILAPVVKNGHLFGILEVVSHRAKELNSINANKLEVVMSFMTDTIERLDAELQNQVRAVIQNNYTTIHGSVYWKFRSEAQRLIKEMQLGRPALLREIVFPDVFPLYGQIDIKGSSDTRNNSVQNDLELQINKLLTLLKEINKNNYADVFDKEKTQLQEYLHDLELALKASTEQSVNDYIETNIHPKLRQIATPELLPAIQNYLDETYKKTGNFHTYRRMYENTITIINDHMTAILDRRQTEAQLLFPHYFERFKTDGVEHNLYIGPSIAPKLEFNIDKLYFVRQWQLTTLCEMEIAHHHLKPSLPYPLDVTTLILVYHSTISIRFRMDEKRFDVDGSYNARFEIVKKRIDKAHIKNTNERITEAGKITIVYSNEAEGQEYTQYIQKLQCDHLLENEIEKFELEDLQGVSGMKALRVKIAH